MRPRLVAHPRAAMPPRRDIPPLLVIDTESAVEDVVRLLNRGLRNAALKIAKRNADVADDLHQEALIYIWQLDPSRFRLSEMNYLRRAAIRRMIRIHKRDAALRRKTPTTVRLR